MNITINGREVDAVPGQSVLDAALAAGIYIPHICKHPDLEAVGGCRLCMVEVEGEEGAVPSCKTEVREGMRVTVDGPEAERVRRMAMELILATHPADCTGCPKYGACELQSMFQYMGVSPQRWRCRARTVPTDETNPLITHMFTRCIRCGRCVRACREVRGANILDYQRTEEGIRIGTDGSVSLEEAGCRFCGACVEVCPTGSIVDAIGLAREDFSYEENAVPCRATCPAHTDIPRYLRHIRNGEWERATAVVREKVPFPETLGAICTHVCEGACKRNDLTAPLSVCRLKRAAAVRDTGEWRARVRHDPLTGRRVAVVGAGPAGLTAGLFLAEKGHAVTVFEANEHAGGQMRYGIPAYRLPSAVVEDEVRIILEIAQGDDAEPRMRILTGERIADPKSLLAEGFDAVLVSVGTHAGTRLPMAGADLEGVYLNTDFLKASREGRPLDVSGHVVVLGGGNVAYDCARTAVRLGAASVDVCCLEAEERMTSTPEERHEGAEEGVVLHDAYAFNSINESAEGSGRVGSVTIQKIKRFSFDENRRAVTELVEGSELTLPADHVIFAVGQRPAGTEEWGLELTHGPYIVADADLMTSEPGVFAAGDVVTGTRSVIAAIAAGRDAAASIDRYLGGDGDISEHLVDEKVVEQNIGRAPRAFFEGRVEPEVMAPEARRLTFDAFECPFSEDEAKREAGRCLQCDLRLTLTRPRLWNEY